MAANRQATLFAERLELLERQSLETRLAGVAVSLSFRQP